LAISTVWQQNPTFWVALLLPLVIVPLYAGSLIETLREARELAEWQSRAKSDLLAKVSHELRTPLTGIMATTELMALENPDSGVRRRTDTILSLSDSLLREINDLLDQAKYTSSEIHLTPTFVNLPVHIGKLSETFASMARKKNIEFDMEVDPALDSQLYLDGHHLERILVNLIGNAVKFTETGGVRAEVRVLRQSPESVCLRFSVTDTGIGIPADFHDKLFEPFSQVDQGAARRYGGTGLGLALSRKIVEAMGGQLQFESQMGKGSKFWFELEARRGEPLAASPANLPIADTPAGLRILLVEDNRTSSALIQELLQLDRHLVTTCESGIAALETLARDSFDVLLLDYNLGDMDGAQVLRTYRFGRKNPSPAIFLTADATSQTSARLIEAGAAGIIHKPVSRANLRTTLSGLRNPDALAVMPAAAHGHISRLERPALRVVQASALDEGMLDELRALNRGNGFLGKLLSQAEIDITRACQQLVDAFANRSYAIVPNVAHALKGVSANVGAVRLANLAGNLLQMPTEDLEAAGDALAADLGECARATVEALRQVIADEGVSSGRSGTLHLN
jgi:two-component system sensor histidine kinase RpfC